MRPVPARSWSRAAIHELSPRSQRPFVAVNCAALPAELVESELFGHEQGAFTGATRRKIGRLEQANGGTLFLDEIGDLPLVAQAKLLRSLQERVLERVGGSESIRIDVRIVAATNRDLAAEVAGNRFRRDLFFRLNVVPLHLPPLRERREDIAALVERFLSRSQQRSGRRDIRISDEGLLLLERHDWPGNVRELENVCARLVALADDGATISAADIDRLTPAEPRDLPLPSAELRDIVDYCEQQIVRRMLDRHSGNRTKTAASLGISRQALQQKLSRYRDEGTRAPLDKGGRADRRSGRA